MGKETRTICARVRLPLLEALDQAAARRGASRASVVVEALEKLLFGPQNNAQHEILRSSLMVRELVLDMSNRPESEKDALWEAMTKRSQMLLTSREEVRGGESRT